jgi:hypothetical protein
MRQPCIYKGYEVSQNILNRKWYANPVNALTTEGQLTADHAARLRAFIDEQTTDLPLNPWELPRASKQLPQVA